MYKFYNYRLYFYKYNFLHIDIYNILPRRENRQEFFQS